MNIKKSFGKKVKEKRLAFGFTQEELAEKIGISAKSLSQIELGNNFVSAENLEAICKALQTKPASLFESALENDIDTYNAVNEKLLNNNDLLTKVYKIISIIEWYL